MRTEIQGVIADRYVTDNVLTGEYMREAIKLLDKGSKGPYDFETELNIPHRAATSLGSELLILEIAELDSFGPRIGSVGVRTFKLNKKVLERYVRILEDDMTSEYRKLSRYDRDESPEQIKGRISKLEEIISEYKTLL